MRQVNRPAKPAAWEARTRIGLIGENYTAVRLYILQPNVSFPYVGLLLSMSNPKGKLFCRFREPQDLSEFGTWCLEKVEEATPTFESLQAKGKLLAEGLEELNARTAASQRAAMGIPEPPRPEPITLSSGIKIDPLTGELVN